jgi:hypothetical protein
MENDIVCSTDCMGRSIDATLGSLLMQVSLTTIKHLLIFILTGPNGRCRGEMSYTLHTGGVWSMEILASLGNDLT